MLKVKDLVLLRLKLLLGLYQLLIGFDGFFLVTVNLVICKLDFAVKLIDLFRQHSYLLL